MTLEGHVYTTTSGWQNTLAFDEAVPTPPTPPTITSEMWGTFVDTMDDDDMSDHDMSSLYDTL
jgi:hypothetical protein